MAAHAADALPSGTPTEAPTGGAQTTTADTAVSHTQLALAVAGASIVVKEALFHWTLAVGKRTSSSVSTHPPPSVHAHWTLPGHVCT